MTAVENAADDGRISVESWGDIVVCWLLNTETPDEAAAVRTESEFEIVFRALSEEKEGRSRVVEDTDAVTPNKSLNEVDPPEVDNPGDAVKMSDVATLPVELSGCADGGSPLDKLPKEIEGDVRDDEATLEVKSSIKPFVSDA